MGEPTEATHVPPADRTPGWRALRGLYVVENLAAGLVLVLLVLVTILGIVMRYVLHQPLPWLIEVQLAGMVWVAFLGSSVAFRHGAHVAIEIVVDLLPRKLQMIAEVLIGLIVYALLAFLASSAFLYLENFVTSGRSTPILEVPYYVVYGIAPISCLLMAISFTTFSLIPTIQRLRAAETIAPTDAEGDAA